MKSWLTLGYWAKYFSTYNEPLPNYLEFTCENLDYVFKQRLICKVNVSN
jgi:hypothetical protein